MAQYSGDSGPRLLESASASQAQRLLIPDVLRGVAIVAMVIAHANPFLPELPWAAKFTTAMFSDLASPLFALVMGMSAEIVWRRGGRVGVTLLQQVFRGLFLIALGVWMASWGSWVDVILAYLGVTIILGAPILLARTPVVIAVTAVLLLISQPLVDLARTWTWVYTAPAPVADIMQWLLLGSHYRVLNLLPMFLIGALLIRHGLQRDRLLTTLAIAAPLAYVAWAVGQRLGAVQSGDYLDTLKDFGLVFAVYVIVVFAATARREGAKRFWSPIFVPLVACGQVALSLYLLHVGLIALWNNANGRPTENFWPGWLVIVPGMILVGWLWWRFVGTGPVEWVMGWLTGRRKPLLRAR
ncbi:acyltransferase family protein [Microbacterium sp. Mcb102]|uniref:acyltransferase family protein n=1 Tax=Microbacterium sp. Mcb102 TaxID=2926012 RepID=UPI0021C7FA0F|nr:acyltransferase family protein [Microbacterium sp. Mcb102]